VLSWASMPVRTLIAVPETSHLSVDVSELLRRPGATKQLRFTHEAGDVRVPLARIAEGSHLVLDLRLEALVDGIHVSGTLEGFIDIECARCLRATTSPITVPLDDVYLPQGEDEADGETFEIADDETIDLEPAVRDALVLALPLNPLCKDECKGLCPECGADRNTTDCGHTGSKDDDRWEPLKRLRERLEE